MGYTALQNSPISVNLLQASKDTGWTVDGNIARHETCNPGYIKLRGYNVIAGKIYRVSWSVLSISGGVVRLEAGGTLGANRSSSGLYVEEITATTDGIIRYYSNATCAIQEFNIQDTQVIIDNKQKNTLTYSTLNKKWSDFRPYNPDFGMSLYVNTFTLYKGALYKHANGGTDRNNFYGQQYKSIVKMVFNVAPDMVKTYVSISLQSNQLMVTTANGISTSLGQISELIDVDFLHDSLTDPDTSVNVYAIEGLFSAMLLRDKNIDLINGDPLKGSYITFELISTENTSLRLFTVQAGMVKSNNSVR